MEELALHCVAVAQTIHWETGGYYAEEYLHGLTTGSVPGCTASDLTKAAAFFPAKVMFGSEALSVCLNNWMGSSQGKGRQRTRRSLI